MLKIAEIKAKLKDMIAEQRKDESRHEYFSNDLPQWLLDFLEHEILDKVM